MYLSQPLETSSECSQVGTAAFDAMRQITDRIIHEIQQFGIQVKLRFPVSSEEDLGHISGSIIEVVTDSVEPTITPFTLCHLFGHMIQFTNINKYRHLIDPVSRKPPVLLSEGFWQEFYAYEREAYAYGVCLLESKISTDGSLLSKYANFMNVDFEHFREYVTSGKRLDRIAYRTRLLHRYASHPTTIPFEPLSIAGVEWGRLSNVEATIY